MNQSGVLQTSVRPPASTINKEGTTANRVPTHTEDAENESPFGGLTGQQGPVNDAPVRERPERQKLREQRVPTQTRTETRPETGDKQVKTPDGQQPETSPKLQRQERLLKARFSDNTWQLQTRFDGGMQPGGDGQLSEIGKRRMQALYLHRLVEDNYQQHTGGKADEAYSRSQYRQILGALSSLGASNTKKNSNDGSRSGEPNTPAALGKKMGDAGRVQQIFEPPPPPPEDYEPLDIAW
ncbi:MAG: hypothetical protein AB1758_29130 [Candidatus Eremiobacterota bacterium]